MVSLFSSPLPQIGPVSVGVSSQAPPSPARQRTTFPPTIQLHHCIRLRSESACANLGASGHFIWDALTGLLLVGCSNVCECMYLYMCRFVGASGHFVWDVLTGLLLVGCSNVCECMYLYMCRFVEASGHFVWDVLTGLLLVGCSNVRMYVYIYIYI